MNSLKHAILTLTKIFLLLADAIDARLNRGFFWEPIHFGLKLSIVAAALYGFEAFGTPWTLELKGGLASPTPGIAAEAQFCSKIYQNGCAGMSYFMSHNERNSHHVTQNGQHFLAVLEHDFFLGDEYHLLYAKFGLGPGYVHLVPSSGAADDSEATRKWSVSYGAGVGIELPIADLIGMRFGLEARQISVSNASVQVAVLGGVKFGLEWFGIGE